MQSTKTEGEFETMDEIDVKLLEILSRDSSQTATEITSQINLSIPAVNKRIAKLKASGIIENFTIQINAKQVDKPVLAFIMVVLNQYSQTDQFQSVIQADPDIVECNAITGEYDYLLKVYAKDIESLEEKLLKLKSTKGIAKSNTMFSLMQHKHLPGPLPD